MFSPAVIRQSLDALLADPSLADLDLPDLAIDEDYPVEACHAFRRRLDALQEEERPGELVRPLDADEQRFILHEQLRSKIDYAYAAVRYHWISAEGMGLMPMFPLWESQQIVLDAIARTEVARQTQQWGALLFNVLKARQLGVSTETQSIMAHYATTQAHQRLLCASDVEGSSVHLFTMFETILDGLPFWLKPKVLSKTDGRRRRFDTGTIYWAEWGKSGRGGLQDQGGAKGNLGRGKTASKFHISEVSTWEHPEQLNDGFFPTIPPRITSFGVAESTAKGRGNWWHHWWTQTDRGQTDFVNVFIPWYAEPSKYSRPCPDDWQPDNETRAHAARAEREGPKYLKKSVQLSREQLYFWERKRREFDEQDALYKFYEEYPAEPEEAFQYSGRSCFPIKTIERIRLAARAPLVVCDLRPQTAAAHILKEARDRQQAADQGLPYAPATVAVAALSDPTVPILLPDGYGFKALHLAELKERKSLLDVLQVWEAPRRRGPRDYVAAVDVSDGLGADRSVVDIFRIPTILEPCEQVAQFITETRTPVELAYVIDALGRWYRSADDLEALAMIECNNHGLSAQDTLQLHLGYGRFYVWEYYDAAQPSKRYSNKIGWVTTQRTRPLILVRLLDAVKAIDPISGQPDLILHSPWTLQDMQDFGTPTGRIADGEAVAGRYDDAVLSAAIGVYGAWRLAGGEHVPIDERRRQQAAERAERAQKADDQRTGRDWRNSPCPADWPQMLQRPEDDTGDPDVTTRFGTETLPDDRHEDATLYFRYSGG